MKKATGKVVSLVLALALVITSFSATFAFAATKTESGEVTLVDSNKKLYLANTNRNGVPAGTTVDLNEFLLENTTMETYDHKNVEDIEIAQVTVSGDNIVKVTRVKDTSNDEYQYTLTVRDKKGTGTATLNVLFNGTVDRDEYEDPVTVRGSAQVEVTLLDANTPILAAAGQEDKIAKGLDGVPSFEKNFDPKTGEVKKTAQIYLPQPENATSAKATYVPQTVSEVASNNDATYKTAYVVEVSGSDAYVKAADKTITYGIGDKPAVGNSLRLSVYKVNDEGAKENKVAVKATVKVENKVNGTIGSIAKGDASDVTMLNGVDKTATLSKSKTYAYDAKTKSYWDVTGSNIVTDSGVVTVTDGKIGDLSASNTATVVINDGTVGNVEGNVITVDGGSVTSVKGIHQPDDESTITINGGTVGEVKGGTAVTVTSGKVTGAVSATEVYLDPANDEESVSVGNVSASTLVVNGTEGKAAAGNFVASGNGTVTLLGDKASIGSIDFDYYTVTLNLNNFVGTVSAPTKATAEEAKIASDDAGYDMTTDAVVNGNLSINTIELNAGQVRFAGNVKAANVYGGEATLIINAGALEITDGVSTSNSLKLADAADVVPGTVVFRAATDIADEESFIGYGYTMRMVSGSSQDAFLVDGVQFAGLTMNVSEADILLGTSETFTASAYPATTQLPEGAYIKFFLDGDENYITGVDNGNGTATIQALKYDSIFSSLNEATLTAYVYDEYDIELEEYGSASVKLNVIEKPKTTYVSDTTGNVDVAVGNTYQFKITSTDGSVPSFAVAGDGNIFRLVEQSNSGNDYFFKVQAVGTPGQVCGVYINREATPVATLTVGANFTCDTTTVNVAAGASYIAKVTANEQPVVAAGNSSYTVELASQSGNDYFFRITAVSAQAGDQVGFYINSSAAPVFIATTV